VNEHSRVALNSAFGEMM